MNLNRRNFLFAGGATVLAGCTTSNVQRSTFNLPPIATAPVLQNAAETSIGVSFAVNRDASGWVDIGEKPDLSDARRVFSGAHGVMTVDDRIALIRVKGLKPATKYYYRIGVDLIDYKHGYNMKNVDSVTDSKIHSFTTLGAKNRGSFCVINDTHDVKPAIALELKKLEALKPSVVIWNGDASNTSENLETAIGIFLKTHEDFPEYAADTPYMFLNGNHDFRGRFNRRLGELMMYREPAERKGEFADLGRNFVQRLGDIALIGLDTGEDKLDTNPIFAGIFQMKPYREEQTRWLAEAIESEAVKTAKKKVVFCHIPLYDPDPRQNPGDVAPADYDPKYLTDYAHWQRTCAQLWSPYFEKAGVDVVITAHRHRFRVDRPSADRKWLHIVGGGPNLNMVKKPESFPTVIEGRMEGDKLRLVVHNVLTGKTVFDETIG